MEWLASSVVAHNVDCANSPLYNSWSIAFSGVESKWLSSSGRKSAEFAAKQLQSLQEYLGEPQSATSSLILQTTGSSACLSPANQSACNSGAIHAAIAAAMLRVAAQEHPTMQFQTYKHDYQAKKRPTVLPGTDSFGIISTAGMWQVPQLTASPSDRKPVSVISSGISEAINGTILVTGGLGNIGLLVGNWISNTSPTARVVLLSRTGHAKALQCTAMTNFTAVHCDVSIAGDLASILSELQSNSAPPVVAVIHAGGILEVRTTHHTCHNNA